MVKARRSRDPIIGLIALVLAPLLSGCFNMSFPGGGVSVQGGPAGGTVNVGFPGGGVNVSGGPLGGNVSVALPGFSMNAAIPGQALQYQSAGDYPNRSQLALFPPPVQKPTL